MEAISAKTIYAFGRQLIINEPLDAVESRSLTSANLNFVASAAVHCPPTETF